MALAPDVVSSFVYPLGKPTAREWGPAGASHLIRESQAAVGQRFA